MNELAAFVRQRANGRCEYCLLLESAFRRSFHCEHIVARQHGGRSSLDNLALACRHCNLKKGPNVAGIDPAHGTMTRLFNPRTDRWPDHFKIATSPQGIQIQGASPIGRTTALVLGFNDEIRVRVRSKMMRLRLWPG